MSADSSTRPKRERARVRSYDGRVVPDWPNVQRYSPEWYRRFRRFWLRRYPGLDPISRANLRLLEEWSR